MELFFLQEKLKIFLISGNSHPLNRLWHFATGWGFLAVTPTTITSKSHLFFQDRLGFPE